MLRKREQGCFLLKREYSDFIGKGQYLILLQLGIAACDDDLGALCEPPDHPSGFLLSLRSHGTGIDYHDISRGPRGEREARILEALGNSLALSLVETAAKRIDIYIQSSSSLLRALRTFSTATCSDSLISFAYGLKRWRS